MAKFRKKPVVIEAFRLNERGLIAEDWFWSFNGKTGTVREFADKYGLSYSCLYERLKLGWSIEDALLTPSRKVVQS